MAPEPSSPLAFIPAKHLPKVFCSSRAVCRGLATQLPSAHGWLGNATLAKSRAVIFLLAPTPCSGCPRCCAAALDVGSSSCCVLIFIHSFTQNEDSKLPWSFEDI